MADDYTHDFGTHVRSLRHARGMTQELLAERSDLSPDTIRRLEQGRFSPSVTTLRKLCTGLEIQPSTLFEGFELGRSDVGRELFDLLSGRSQTELERLARIIRVLLEECGGLAGEDDGDAD